MNFLCHTIFPLADKTLYCSGPVVIFIVMSPIITDDDGKRNNNKMLLLRLLHLVFGVLATTDAALSLDSASIYVIELLINCV